MTASKLLTRFLVVNFLAGLILSLNLLIFLMPAPASAGTSPFTNIRDRIAEINLAPYLSRASVRPVTVAVFDLDFTGWDQEKGKTLPAQTEYRPGPHPSQLPATGHGLAMAQIAWSAASNGGVQSNRPVRVLLYQTAGYSQFKWAVQDAIKEKVDVVLYAQVWEFGSNFDGKGFLNVLVDQAIASGITWVNAAGNYGSLTYNAHVSNEIQNVEMNCTPSHDDASGAPVPAPGAQSAAPAATSCSLRMVLSWNDFNDDPEVATTKDLDLDLVDLNGDVVGSSHLRQVGTPAAGETKSKYAREMIEMSVPAGRYFAHVTVQSDNFSEDDQFRIVVSGNGIQMPDATRDDSVLPPADNKNAITASAGDSDIASWSASSGKPDFWTSSEIVMADQAEFLGSSNSAALIAGSVALLKSLWPAAALSARGITVRDLKLDDWKALIDLTSVGRTAGTGVSTQVSGVEPQTGGSCFTERKLRVEGRWLPGATSLDGSSTVATWTQRGAVFVNTSQGPKLMMAVDPTVYFSGMPRSDGNNAIMIDAQSGEVNLVPRSQVREAQKNNAVELMQLPSGFTVCGREARGWRAGSVAPIQNGARTPYFILPGADIFDAWLK